MVKDVLRLLDDDLHRSRTLNWEGSFQDYLEMVAERPYLAMKAHERVYRMMMESGAEHDAKGNLLHYKFFDGEIFGIPEVQEAIVDYFRAASQGMEVRKRVLLLMGPPAGGKSSIVTLLKRRLADWTRTDAGAVYAIKGCPLNEDPLHLLPLAAREQMSRDAGIQIEGDLCPVCRYRLENEWGRDPREATVVRVRFSEAARVGVGTFTPSDPKSQDVSELIGSMNLATVGQFGDESHPYAYKFNGELHVANRGMMEFVELLKVDHRFLYVLLTLAQEQVIKAPRYPLIYCDEVVVSHTNEAEFQRFLAEKTNEALQDRMHVIRVPYNLRVSDEEKIYAKLVRQGNLQNVHIAPLTLRVAAMFGVLSRLDEKTSTVKLTDKMRLYDGETLEGWTQHQVRELMAKAPREGMEGLGPRFIIDGIAKAMGRPDVRCVNPLDAMKGLLEHLDHHPTITPEMKERYKNVLALVRKEYDRNITKEISRSFVHAFEEQARDMVDRYITEVMAFKQKDKVTDPITGAPRDADERFMRAVEEQIGVAEGSKREFREEILTRIAYLATKGGGRFDYTSHSRLREGVEGKLFADVRGMMKAIARTPNPDKDQQQRLDTVIGQLQQGGYCEHCAREVLRYVGHVIDA